VCIVLSWLGPFSMDAYSPAFPVLASDLAISDRLVQLTLTATLIGMCLGQLVFGPLSDRWGRRRPLVWAMGGFVVASVVCMLAPTIWWLVLGRFLQGVAASAGLSIARAVGRDVYQGVQLVRFYSWVGATTAIAPIVGPLAGAALVEDGSWRPIFGMITVLGAVALLSVVLLLPETRWSAQATEAPVVRRPDGTHKVGLGHHGIARLAVVSVVLAGTNGAVLAYLAGSSFLLQDGYGLSATEYSQVFAVNAVGIVALSVANSSLIRRFSSVTLLTVSVPVTLGVGIGLMACAVNGAGLVAILALFAVLIASLGIVIPNATALAMDGSRERAGLVSGVLGVAQFSVGAVVAPLVGGAGSGGVPTMFVAILVCTGASTLALLVGHRTVLRSARPAQGGADHLDERRRTAPLEEARRSEGVS
jgi:DHA1 family bicyclomycin/chloramphenicol resistance-like MFS transporter